MATTVAAMSLIRVFRSIRYGNDYRLFARRPTHTHGLYSCIVKKYVLCKHGGFVGFDSLWLYKLQNLLQRLSCGAFSIYSRLIINKPAWDSDLAWLRPGYTFGSGQRKMFLSCEKSSQIISRDSSKSDVTREDYFCMYCGRCLLLLI